MKSARWSLLSMVFLVVMIGCSPNADLSSLWSKAEAVGENKFFSVIINGRAWKFVWVSATDHLERKARRQAHQHGLRLLGKNAHIVDIRVTRRDDDQHRVDILMAIAR